MPPPPQLPLDAICQVLRHAAPCDWRACALVSQAWRLATTQRREEVVVLGLHAHGRSLCALIGSPDRSSLFTSSRDASPGRVPDALAGMQLLDLDMTLGVERLAQLLAAFPRARVLRLTGVQFRAAGPAAGRPPRLGMPSGDGLLDLIVHVLHVARHLEVLSLDRCSGLSVGSAGGKAGDKAATEAAPGAASFPTLKELKVSQMDGLSGPGAAWLLARAPALRSLDLSNSDSELEALTVLPRTLASLNVEGCFCVQEAAVEGLLRSGSYAGLETLVLPGAMPLGLAFLACEALPRLRALNVGSSYLDSDAAGPVPALSHVALRALRLPHMHTSQPCELRVVCPQLRTLDLQQHSFVGGGLSRLDLSAPFLESLDLRWNAVACVRAAAPLAGLRALLLDGCARLSPGQLEGLLAHAKALEELSITECDQLRRQGEEATRVVLRVLAANPNLKLSI